MTETHEKKQLKLRMNVYTHTVGFYMKVQTQPTAGPGLPDGIFSDQKSQFG
jgi:hypothetical protein